MSKWPVSGDWEWSASKLGYGVCIDLHVDKVLYRIILTKAIFSCNKVTSLYEMQAVVLHEIAEHRFTHAKWYMLISYSASFTFLVKLNCCKYSILRISHIVIRSMTFDLSIHSLFRFLCNNVQYQTVVIKMQNSKPVHRNSYLAVSCQY